LGLTSAEQAELVAARKRIRELETEVAVHRRAPEVPKGTSTQKAVRGDPRDGRGWSPYAACQLLGVSASGYYDYRARRMYAKLTLGHAEWPAVTAPLLHPIFAPTPYQGAQWCPGRRRILGDRGVARGALSPWNRLRTCRPPGTIN